MDTFLKMAKAGQFSYLDQTGNNRPVQLLKIDRQNPVATGRFNFINRSGPAPVRLQL
jgi:hypothetical protein